MGDSKFAEALELMAFLANLVGIQNIQRFIPLARVADPGTTCRLAIPVGDAAREIAGFAARRGPSLVVLGKRGADEAPAGSLGSVARELVLRGSVSVLALDDAPVVSRPV